jgi:hypothetical protein
MIVVIFVAIFIQVSSIGLGSLLSVQFLLSANTVLAQGVATACGMPSPAYMSMTTSDLALALKCPHCEDLVWLHAMLSAFPPPLVMEKLLEEEDALETPIPVPPVVPPVGSQASGRWRPTMPELTSEQKERIYSRSPAPVPELPSEQKQRILSRSPAPTSKPGRGAACQAYSPALFGRTASATTQAEVMIPEPMKPVGLGAEPKAAGQHSLDNADIVADVNAGDEPKAAKRAGGRRMRGMHPPDSTDIAAYHNAGGQPKSMCIATDQKASAASAPEEASGSGAQQKGMGQGTQRIASPSPMAKPGQGAACQAPSPAPLGPTPAETAAMGLSTSRGRSLTTGPVRRHHASSTSTSRDRPKVKWPSLLPEAPPNYRERFWELIWDTRFVAVHLGAEDTWRNDTYTSYALELALHISEGQRSGWIGETDVMPVLWK